MPSLSSTIFVQYRFSHGARDSQHRRVAKNPQRLHNTGSSPNWVYSSPTWRITTKHNPSSRLWNVSPQDLVEQKVEDPFKQSIKNFFLSLSVSSELNYLGFEVTEERRLTIPRVPETPVSRPFVEVRDTGDIPRRSYSLRLLITTTPFLPFPCPQLKTVVERSQILQRLSYPLSRTGGE